MHPAGFLANLFFILFWRIKNAGGLKTVLQRFYFSLFDHFSTNHQYL